MASLRNHPRLAGVATLVILVIAAAAAWVLTFDPNAEKSRIIEAVRAATGRELVLAGPLHLAFGLRPVLEAEDVSFANAPGGSRPQMAMATRVEAQVALLPLLSRRVEIDHVTLIRPDILLETDAQGRGNWQFQRPVTASVPGPPSAPSEPGRRTAVALNRLRVEDGRVTWRDRSGRTVIADVPRATLDLGTGPAHVVAEARVQDMPVALDATLGTQAQLAGAGAWPIVLSLTAGDAALKLNGTTGLPFLTHGYHGRVDLTAPDLARFGTVLQAMGLDRAGLPALHDVRFGAMLAGEGLIPVPQDVTLHVGASSIGDVGLTRLDVTWPSAAQPARLEAEGAFPSGPWRLSSGVAPAGLGVALRGANFVSGFGDLTGDVALGFGRRPTIRGTLLSQRLNLDALLAPPSPPPSPVAPASVPVPAPTPAPAAPSPPPVFPDTDLPWQRLRQLNLNLNLQMSISDLVLRGGRLSQRCGPCDAAGWGAADRPVRDAGAGGPCRPVVQHRRGPAGAARGARAPLGRFRAGPAAAGVRPAGRIRRYRRGGREPAQHRPFAACAGEPSGRACRAGAGRWRTVERGAGGHAGRRSALGAGRGGPGGAQPCALLCAAAGRAARPGLGGGAETRLDPAAARRQRRDRPDAEIMALRLRPLLRLGSTGILTPVRLDGSLTRPAVQLDSPSAAGRPAW
ncbi:MAG: AsmA family protein [Acetobacteraceae bacterium]